MREDWGLIVLIVLIIVGVFVGIYLITNDIESEKERQAQIVPNPPAAVRVVSKTSKQVEFAWNNDDIKNELGYRVYRNGIMIAELPKDTTGYIDYHVEPSTLYTYEITAYNDTGESTKSTITTKSNNPPLVIRLDKIGVIDNGEDYFRESLDRCGEIYIGVVIRDGTIRPQGRRLPVKGFYHLADNSEFLLGDVIYISSSVGDYINLDILGLEHDFGGTGDDLLIEALNHVVISSMGTLTSAILTMARVDFKKEITEIGGFRDDFLGEYNVQWDASDNWGVGTHQKDLDKGDGKIGLRLWYTIYSPSSGS